MKWFSFWAPVVLYMAAIFYVSSLPEPPPILAGSDKSLHLSAYFGLTLVVVRAVAGGLAQRIGIRTAVVALLIAIGYGVTDEVHQMFVAGRSADVYDLFRTLRARSPARPHAGRGVYFRQPRAMNFENVLHERDGAAALLTISRPPVLNAFNRSIRDQFRRVGMDR